MPTYLYVCPNCSSENSIVKKIVDIDRDELCLNCDHKLISKDRRITGGNGFLYEKVENAEFNPGLGCVVRNRSHKRELCKRMGVEEIGNEKPESIHKYFDKSREEKRLTSWAKVYD